MHSRRLAIGRGGPGAARHGPIALLAAYERTMHNDPKAARAMFADRLFAACNARMAGNQPCKRRTGKWTSGSSDQAPRYIGLLICRRRSTGVSGMRRREFDCGYAGKSSVIWECVASQIKLGRT